MTDDGYNVMKYQQKFEEAKSLLEKYYNKEFTSNFLSSLLGHYFDIDNVHEFLIFNKEIDDIDLKTLLEEEIKHVAGSLNFDSPDFNFISSDKIEKAKVKENGLIWIIHNNDNDPFPSKPHAHNYDLNVKLHLGTGGMFRKEKEIGKIKKNELRRLQTKVINKGIKLPI